ncbi:hypothetical protein Tco_0805446 [Tanacetum coccineum]
MKIYSNPLFEFDDEYISSDSTFLVTALFNSNEDECSLLVKVELLLYRNSSTPIISVVSILEGFTEEPPLEENDDLFDLEYKGNEWKNILYDAPIDDLMTEDKVFDPGIHETSFSLTYVSLPLRIAIIFPSHMIAWILKALVLVVLSIVHSIFNPSYAYIWESDIPDLID